MVVVLIAACGNQTVAPTIVATPTATGSPSSNPSTRPSASPTANPGTAALNAFVALVTKAGFSYQATFTGESRHTTTILPLSKGLLLVAGNDVLVQATFRFPNRQLYAVEHRFVGGKSWIRYDATENWQRLTYKPADSMAAFAAVHGKADVTDLGPITSGGKTYEQVSFRSAIVNPVMIPATNLTEAVVTSPKLTVLLDPAGRPVKGTAEIDGRGRISGQLQEIVIDLTITFTKVGEAVVIHAP